MGKVVNRLIIIPIHCICGGLCNANCLDSIVNTLKGVSRLPDMQQHSLEGGREGEDYGRHLIYRVISSIISECPPCNQTCYYRHLVFKARSEDVSVPMQ